jgi:hypothetical protein
MRCRIEAVRIAVPQVHLLSDVPRAVFEGLLRTTPGGLSFQNPSAVGVLGAYPPLWDLDSAWPLARSYGAAAKGPGDANLSHRDRPAWAAAGGVYVGHPSFRMTRGHRTPPRISDAADAPRLGRDGAGVIGKYGSVKE